MRPHPRRRRRSPLRNTLDLEDAQGNQVCRIQTRVLHVRDSMMIEDPDGERIALVHKALISPRRERCKVDLAGDQEWKIQGNVVDHEYEIEADGRRPTADGRGFTIRSPETSRMRTLRSWSTPRCRGASARLAAP